ncbi:MAG: glycerophosphodiester phosphodiesterase family protein [Elusimicrobiota bacterium]
MRRVLNIAHRGARSLAPENTLAAARKGHACGADLWETDIAVTRDGELILMHDDTFQRTTDVAQRFPERAASPFTSFTLPEIRTLDAGSWFNTQDPYGQIAAGAVTAAEQESFRGLKVPTLREALTLTRDLDWRVNLELKRLPGELEDYPVAGKVLELIDAIKLDPRHVLISSIRQDWLWEIRGQRPDIEVQVLLGLMPDDPIDFGEREFETYNVRITRISENEVHARTEEGLAVNLYVANEEDGMRRFADAGAAGLITDFPQRLKDLLES